MTAVSINSESIMVTWSLPQRPNGPLNGFKVYYKRSNVTTSPPGSEKTGYESKTKLTGNECNISGLAPLTNYTIFVIAVGTSQRNGRVDIEILVLTRRGTK